MGLKVWSNDGMDREAGRQEAGPKTKDRSGGQRRPRGVSQWKRWERDYGRVLGKYSGLNSCVSDSQARLRRGLSGVYFGFMYEKHNCSCFRSTWRVVDQPAGSTPPACATLRTCRHPHKWQERACMGLASPGVEGGAFPGYHAFIGMGMGVGEGSRRWTSVAT